LRWKYSFVALTSLREYVTHLWEMPWTCTECNGAFNRLIEAINTREESYLGARFRDVVL